MKHYQKLPTYNIASMERNYILNLLPENIWPLCNERSNDQGTYVFLF